METVQRLGICAIQMELWKQYSQFQFQCREYLHECVGLLMPTETHDKNS